jgi:hypothetical protein
LARSKTWQGSSGTDGPAAQLAGFWQPRSSIPSSEAAGTLTPDSRQRLRRQRETRSTSTITNDGRLAPWLAAKGRLAYRPEQPPQRDHYVQYGWGLAEGLR